MSWSRDVITPVHEGKSALSVRRLQLSRGLPFYSFELYPSSLSCVVFPGFLSRAASVRKSPLATSVFLALHAREDASIDLFYSRATISVGSAAGCVTRSRPKVALLVGLVCVVQTLFIPPTILSQHLLYRGDKPIRLSQGQLGVIMGSATIVTVMV